ncbi:MAG: sensor domain-containing diguanylate cyclase [Mycobacteriales bacterium]
MQLGRPWPPDDSQRSASSTDGSLALPANLTPTTGPLPAGRDQWRRDLAMLGHALASSHDLDRILAVVLDTSMAAAGARSGAIFLTGRKGLSGKAARGLGAEAEVFRVRTGEGIVGWAATLAGEPIAGRPTVGGPYPADGEPHPETYIAVAFQTQGRLLGVLALYDRVGGADFDRSDVATVKTFAAQAAVAIDNVQMHRQAKKLSLTDPLTGLWNFRYFQLSFARDIERAARFGRELTLLMLDVDRFKDINDTYGHPRGDAVLVALARRIELEIRDVDVLSRYGGEEMVVVLPETGLQGAGPAADRICQRVRAEPLHVKGVPGGIPVTVSIGAAVFPANGKTAAEIIRRADGAMYAAKSGGRDTWRMARRVKPPASPKPRRKVSPYPRPTRADD